MAGHARIPIVTCIALAAGVACAEVRVHHIFDNNMVLQRDKPVRVWGWADAGEKVRVEFADQSEQVTVGAAGAWEVRLAAMPASARPREMVVKGKLATTVQVPLLGAMVVFSFVSLWLMHLDMNMRGTLM